MHSFTEGPLLGGLDLAINGKPRAHSLTFDGLSIGRRHDGELRANFLRMCALLRICAFFGIIIQFRPHSPPRHNVKNQPVTVRAMLGEHHPKIPLALCLRHDQNPSFMLVSPSTTYVGCERRKTVGHTQNMILSNNVASPRVRGHDVERSSDTKYICLNGWGSHD